MKVPVSVIIPALNEEKRLPATLDSFIAYLQANPDRNFEIAEIIVVDDGSTDDTSAAAKQFSERLPIILIYFEKNKGKGAALRSGVMAASGEFVLLYDADGATQIDELQKTLQKQSETNADVIIGSRMLHHTTNVIMKPHRRFIGWLFHVLCAPLLPGIADASCGFKLIRLSVAKELFTEQTEDRFAYDTEILMIAIQRGYSIEEVPVKWTAVEQSKVRLLRDGVQMFVSVLKMYFRPSQKKG